MAEGGYKIRNQEGLYFVTFTVVQWIDLFTRPVFAEIVVDSLNFCVRKKGLQVHCWVLMPNHFHGILSAAESLNLSDIIRDFKKFTAGKILKELEKSDYESRKEWLLWLFKGSGARNSRNEQYQFWQQDNHPVELTNSEMIAQRMNYLHENPVKSGLVWEPWHYRYSSACDYSDNGKGLVEIELI
jgi:putative transposase